MVVKKYSGNKTRVFKTVTSLTKEFQYFEVTSPGVLTAGRKEQQFFKFSRITRGIFDL